MPKVEQFPDLMSKFLAHIDEDQDDPINGCWNWEGGFDGEYPIIHWGKKLRAQIVSYQLFNGPVDTSDNSANGIVTDHLCLNKRCVRPEHLEAITRAENSSRDYFSDARNKARAEKDVTLKIHCIHGHEYTDSNTYINPNRQNERRCRICMRDAELRRK